MKINNVKIKKFLSRAALLLMIALIFFTLSLNAKTFYDLTLNETNLVSRDLLKSVSAAIEDNIKDSKLLVWEVAYDIERLLQSNASETEIFAYLINKMNLCKDTNSTNIYVAGSDWYVIPNLKRSSDFIPQERSWYVGACKAGSMQLYVTSPYRDFIKGSMCYTVSMLLADEDTVVSVDFDLSSFQSNLLTICNETDCDALIVTSTGQVVSYSNEYMIGKQLSDVLPSYNDIFQRILSFGESDLTFTTNLNNAASTVSYTRTANNWYLITIANNWTLYREGYLQIVRNTVLSVFFVIIVLTIYIIEQKRQMAYEFVYRTQSEKLEASAETMHKLLSRIAQDSDFHDMMQAEDIKSYLAQLRNEAVQQDKLLNVLLEKYSTSALLQRHNDEKKKRRIITNINSRKNHLILVSIFMVLILTTIITIFLSGRILLNAGKNKMESETENYYNQLNLWLTEQHSILDMFTSSITASPEIIDDYDACVGWLNGIVQQFPAISVCYIADAESEYPVIMNNGWTPPPNWSLSDRQWYKETITSPNEDGFNVSSPYYDTQTGLYCITMSRRVYDLKGHFLGVFAIDFYLDKLMSILSASYNSEGYAFLVDRDGIIINHPNKSYEINIFKNTPVENAGYMDVLYNENPVLIQDYDNQYRVAMSKINDESHFSVICVKDWDIIYGNTIRNMSLMVFLFIICITSILYLFRTLMRWQRQSNDSLQKAVDAATRAGQAKSQFLALVSHEIRTPINAVLGMDEIILREYDDPQLLEYAANIQTSGRTLLGQVNDILDFSKIEAGKMEIIPVDYEVSLLINDVVNMISPRAKSKNLTLNVKVDPNIPSVLHGDDVRIRQCIANILTNAVKYTEKGSVTLEFSCKNDTEDTILFTCKVTDTGIGIRPEDMDRLFSPFERIEEERNHTIEGTGLGMSILTNLLRLMDSKLEVESSYGFGSTFSFTLVQEIVDLKPIGDYHAKVKETYMKKIHYHETFQAPNASILVVDDLETNLMVVCGLLKSTHIKIDTALSGDEALKMIKLKHYDVIFLDHRMPGKDGIETLAKMRSSHDHPNQLTPCIILTANALSGAREEYMRAGFDDFLSKPIDSGKLEQLLMQFLPEDKLIYPEDENSTKAAFTGGSPKQSVPVNQTKKEEPAAATPPFDEEMLSYKNVDLNEAVKNCGSVDVLREVIKQFRDTIPMRSEKIETLAADHDIRNYTIEVHALKSSARLIGAMKLSAMAADLEAKGDAGDEEAISAGTPALLDLYRSYLDNLSTAKLEEAEDTREEISTEELKEILDAMHEFAEAFDISSAKDAYAALEEYKLPTKLSEPLKACEMAIMNADRDELLKQLDSLLSLL